MNNAAPEYDPRRLELDKRELVRAGVYSVLIVLMTVLAAFQTLVVPEDHVVQAVFVWFKRGLTAMPPILAMLLGAMAMALWSRRMTRLRICRRLGFWTRSALSLGLLLWVIYVLGCVGVMSAWFGWAIGAAGLVGVAAWWCLHGPWRGVKRENCYWLGWLPGLALLSVAASVPAGFLWRIEALGYDACTYHLQLPRIWMAQGRMTGLSHQVYSYLPNLMEAGYLQIMLMQPRIDQAVVSSQWFHAVWMLLFAGCLLELGRACQLKHAMGWAVGVVLLVPWVLITGSLAYNEAGMLALGTAMLGVAVLVGRGGSRECAVLLGIAAGLAVMMKLTAGLMLVPPIVGMWIFLHWRRGLSWRQGVSALLLFGLTAVVVASPYLLRNAAETGNPLFPFAINLFGAGHWQSWQVENWQAAHFVSVNANEAVGAWVRQWLTNPGYGAFGGIASESDALDIARFDQSYGIPVFWLLALAGGVAAWRMRQHRLLVIGMGLMLLWQFLAWAVWTHLQSRFLIATVLPGSLLVTLVFLYWDRACVTWQIPRMRYALPIVVVVLMAVLSLTILWQQTPRISRSQDGLVLEQPLFLPLTRLVQSDVTKEGHLLQEHIEPTDRVLLVGDYQRLIYLPVDTIYASPFDQHPLGDVIEAAGRDPHAVYMRLREQEVDWIWIHPGELERFHQTYGFDPRVTEARLQELIRLAARRIPIRGQSILLRVHE